MSDSEAWPVSTIDEVIIRKLVRKFLRTHKRGVGALIDLLDAASADITEAEFDEEQTRKAAERKKVTLEALERAGVLAKPEDTIN